MGPRLIVLIPGLDAELADFYAQVLGVEFDLEEHGGVLQGHGDLVVTHSTEVPGVVVAFGVSNLEDAVNRATSLGGQLSSLEDFGAPPTSALVQDPVGNVIMLIGVCEHGIPSTSGECEHV